MCYCLTQAIILYFVIITITTSIRVLAPNYGTPEYLLWTVDLFSLDQEWNMFSPAPPKVDTYWTIQATLEDNTTLDLFRMSDYVYFKKTPFTWERPTRMDWAYGDNQRWYDYFIKGPMVNTENGFINNFCVYLCRGWNSRYSGGEKLKTFNIFARTEVTIFPNKREYLEPKQIWYTDCGE